MWHVLFMEEPLCVKGQHLAAAGSFMDWQKRMALA
jgi:hypothetical protein